MDCPEMAIVNVDEHGADRRDDPDQIQGSLSPSSSSMESDSLEEVISPTSASSSSSDLQSARDPLNDMSSLIQHLPVKRGLSNFYQGKSMSFTSLANVRSLEDLAKRENPNKKRLKACRSYGDGARPRSSKCFPNSLLSRPMRRRSGWRSRKGAGSFVSDRPPLPPLPALPLPPHASTRTSTMTRQTVLFA